MSFYFSWFFSINMIYMIVWLNLCTWIQTQNLLKFLKIWLVLKNNKKGGVNLKVKFSIKIYFSLTLVLLNKSIVNYAADFIRQFYLAYHYKIFKRSHSVEYSAKNRFHNWHIKVTPFHKFSYTCTGICKLGNNFQKQLLNSLLKAT